MEVQPLELIDSGPFGELVFAIRYGSGVNDVDVLVVYEPAPFQRELMVGQLDCILVGRVELQHCLNLLDPAFTEPILSGNLVRGDGDVLEQLREGLNTVEITANSRRHLLRSSFASHNSAVCALERATAQPTSPMFRLFWKNLSWSISYLAFSMEYVKRGPGPALRLAGVIDHMAAGFREIWSMTQARKHVQDLRSCQDALAEWEAMLTRPMP